jgi:NAD(P)-dependent dehydrogenase (short-subunit alcohol dehydrogenase family)
MRFEGKVAMVTGAGQGIGRAIALSLAREGADVVVSDIVMETAKAVAEEIKSMGHRALAIKADVTKSKEVNEMIETGLHEMGRIDILVNNAGGSAREKAVEFAQSKEEIWDSVIGRNLKGVLSCTRAVINHMIQRGSGKVVNIGSGAGVNGSPKKADYSAAKAGVIGFTKAFAKEVGKYGINVNCVSPGVIRTAATEQAPGELVDAISKQALKRSGEPQDIANAVIFLASEEASFITGQNLVVCGGKRIS